MVSLRRLHAHENSQKIEALSEEVGRLKLEKEELLQKRSTREVR
jgi:hypothetical protein